VLSCKYDIFGLNKRRFVLMLWGMHLFRCLGKKWKPEERNMKTFSTKPTQKGRDRASYWHQNIQRFSATRPKGTLSDFVDNRPEAIAQKKLQETDNSSPRMVSQRQQLEDASGRAVQKKKNNNGLPDGLKAGIENISGLSMDDVNVYHNSSKPAQLQALAYTQGTEIHLGPGQARHLPHEAWHVVQQQQGRVKPTIQTQALAINDDTTLEHEANVMGAKAMQMHHSEKRAFRAPIHAVGFRSSNIVQRTEPDTPQILGDAFEGTILLADRPVVALTMSQAVVANLKQLSFYSNYFSSCSPVVMYNEHSSIGGLFHFPGGGLDPELETKEDTERRLLQMYEDVRPTNVWLNSRYDPAMAFYGAAYPSDVDPITNYLKDDLKYTGPIQEIEGRGSAYSFYLDEEMAPQVVMGGIPVPTGDEISVLLDRTVAEREQLAEDWQGLPLAIKYGIDRYSDVFGR
jgi:hypothetical protein